MRYKIMTREEFIDTFWDYYLVLEQDFLSTERYVSFDLGDNYLYDRHKITRFRNSRCFSTEFAKQYQAICSEIDVILKAICKELKVEVQEKNICEYTKAILSDSFWKSIISQEVEFKNIKLQPFMKWSVKTINKKETVCLKWWTLYNEVKHNRAAKYQEANLKNVLNSLAGLYILENYLVKYIGDRDGSRDVPNDMSKIFTMVNWSTKHGMLGKNLYDIIADKIDSLEDI